MQKTQNTEIIKKKHCEQTKQKQKKLCERIFNIWRRKNKKKKQKKNTKKNWRFHKNIDEDDEWKKWGKKIKNWKNEVIKIKKICFYFLGTIFLFRDSNLKTKIKVFW